MTANPASPESGSAHKGDLYDPNCPCRGILDLVASRWAALIIGRLELQPHRFGALRRDVTGISQKMLTETLRRLEREGIVRRTVLDRERPPQVEYSLTSLGASISPVLAAIRTWAESHLPDVLDARSAFDREAAEA